ncbi:hypothetical protein AHAS_Ahas07G0159400 [Arachis hypogaea]|uniref:Mediator complex subunit 15 KIX domain-containing protein n=1 Tax=Arachis hypogaea TaxID=3818 RepID=A0A445CHP0_ARAHY|nr:hypothetical protein Ahy_A07g037036 [Arachis hypogaea]
MDTTTTSNWRDQLHPETRQLLLNNIMNKLKIGHPLGDYDEDLEFQKIAHSIEQKSYGGATNQADYFDEIASKLLLLEKAREREWRSQLRPDSRQRIVNKIMEKIGRHLPVSRPEGSQELWKIARRLEEKIFAAASSQTDYLRKISLKMLTMETIYQGRHEHANPGFGMQQFLAFTNNSNAIDSS